MVRRASPEAVSSDPPADAAPKSRVGLRLAEVEAEAGPIEVDRRNKLNELTSKEWIAETKSFWFQKGLGADHEHAEIERLHPAPFSYQDVSRLIRFFTKQGDEVLDPFLGVGSTVKACALLGRPGVGIELMPTWGHLAQLRLDRELENDGDTTAEQEIIVDDVRQALPLLADCRFQLVVTSPPYWKILNKAPDHKTLERVSDGLALSYGEDTRDLGNVASYDDFLSQLIMIFADCERVTRPGGHLAIIVGDFRHGSTFIPFHADLARELPRNSNWTLQAVNVVLQNHKRLFPYGYPYAYVPNIHHQFLLIFRRSPK
jgi:DNA modification methylase